MRRLMLLRHSKTETDAASGRDFDRRLDERGIADAKTIGQWLLKRGQQPARVLISPAVRALQTWEHLAAALPNAPKPAHVEGLYGAVPNELLAVIRDNGSDAPSLMVVAHNPGLHELALALAGSGDGAARDMLDKNLPTSGLAILDFDAAHWRDVSFRAGRLVELVSPKTLREPERG